MTNTSRIDFSKWGPLSILVVVSVLAFEVFIAAYLIVARPSTHEVVAFVAAAAGLLASPAFLGLAHAILGKAEADKAAAIAVSLGGLDGAESAGVRPAGFTPSPEQVKALTDATSKIAAETITAENITEPPKPTGTP